VKGLLRKPYTIRERGRIAPHLSYGFNRYVFGILETVRMKLPKNIRT
jgi:hypothetical protein